MGIALVVDAACDLPQQFIHDRGIVLVPISIHVDDQFYVDDKDPVKMQAFYSKDLLTLEHDAESIPYSSDQMARLFVDEVIPNHDFALVQTVSRRRSQIFENFNNAQPEILKAFRKMKEAGTKSHFGMRVMNSSTVFTGQGILAIFTSDLIQAGHNKQDIVRLSEAFKGKIYTYAVPPDVGYIRDRARKRGEDSLSALGALVAKSLDIKPIIQAKDDATMPIARVRGFQNAVERLFQYAIKRINIGLLSPNVIVSYGGDLEELNEFPSYLELLDVAQRHKVKVHSCAMGLTTSLNIGPRSVSLALAAEEHSFEE